MEIVLPLQSTPLHRLAARTTNFPNPKIQVHTFHPRFPSKEPFDTMAEFTDNSPPFMMTLLSSQLYYYPSILNSSFHRNTTTPEQRAPQRLQTAHKTQRRSKITLNTPPYFSTHRIATICISVANFMCHVAVNEGGFEALYHPKDASACHFRRADSLLIKKKKTALFCS